MDQGAIGASIARLETNPDRKDETGQLQGRWGKVQEKQSFTSGEEEKLTKKGQGRYHLDIGTDTIEVYVLREILQG